MSLAKKIFIIVGALFVCIILFLVCFKKHSNPVKQNIILKDSYAREAYLNLKGWDVDLISGSSIRIPESFEGIYSTYAEIQKKQNLPLESYKGETAERFLYKVNNYNGDYDVYAELLISGNELVAAALIQQTPDGFIKELY
ncbi:MAG: DUF4830 domain-containing protein [Ruminococcus sp.]|nr:DUF4830 domain-containing protein [Ruminococcus sp.]